MEERKVKELVQQETRIIKKLTAVLVVIVTLSTICNILTMKNYNQIIKKEKVFLERAEQVLFNIENH